MRKRVVLFLSFLVLLAMACNLTSVTGSTPQAPGNEPQGGGNQPSGGDGSQPSGGGDQPGGILQPAGTPPANPISMNEGLGSLNSYFLTISIKSVGPDPTQSSTTTVEMQRSKDADANETHINSTTVKKGGGDPNITDSTIYRIGNNQCSGTGDQWTWTSNTPAEVEMQGLVKSMIGLTPLVDTPTFVAQETVNGIPVNHFTFTVSGLGVKSGAQVNANQGDYWLAVDGQYIVKYNLVVETSSDPQTNVMHEEVSIDLNQINQPIAIAFPQGCVEASLVTPTP